MSDIAKKERKVKKIDNIILFTIQISHGFFLLSLAVSMPFLLILEPLYISLPICSWMMHLTFNSRLRCPYTDWENYYRVKTGRKQIGGFIGHHLKIIGLKKKKK